MLEGLPPDRLHLRDEEEDLAAAGGGGQRAEAATLLQEGQVMSGEKNGDIFNFYLSSLAIVTLSSLVLDSRSQNDAFSSSPEGRLVGIC